MSDDEVHAQRQAEARSARGNRLPIALKLFCAYLLAMLVVVLLVQILYAWLVDDWTLGLKDRRAMSVVSYLGVTLLVAQHVYRIVTVAAILLKASFAVANARIYLRVSLGIMLIIVASSVVSFPHRTDALGPHAPAMLVQDIGQGIAVLGAVLALILPWWLVLSRSKAVKAFETSTGA